MSISMAISNFFNFNGNNLNREEQKTLNKRAKARKNRKMKKNHAKRHN